MPESAVALFSTESFAELDDLAQLWRPLSDQERITAVSKLGAASVSMANYIGDKGGVIKDVADRTPSEKDTLKIVCCDMVKRAMSAPVDSVPISSSNQMSGPYTMQQTYVNPLGELYLSKSNKADLSAAFNLRQSGKVRQVWPYGRGNHD